MADLLSWNYNIKREKAVFFDKRRRFNGDVATLAKEFGIDPQQEPLTVLSIIDHAWLNKFNAHESAMLLGYSHAANLYKIDVTHADEFTMSRLYPRQLQWLSAGLIRAEVIEPMTRTLRGRAYEAYSAARTKNGSPIATAAEVKRGFANSARVADINRSVPPTNWTTDKRWIFNRRTNQLIRRESGETFDGDKFHRDGPGLVIRDHRFPWAADREIKYIG